MNLRLSGNYSLLEDLNLARGKCAIVLSGEYNVQLRKCNVHLGKCNFQLENKNWETATFSWVNATFSEEMQV